MHKELEERRKETREGYIIELYKAKKIDLAAITLLDYKPYVFGEVILRYAGNHSYQDTLDFITELCEAMRGER